MIYSSESNAKIDYISVGVLALCLFHNEMGYGPTPYPFLTKRFKKPLEVNPEGDRTDPPTERPPSRSSLVVSPWFVVDDVASVVSQSASETTKSVVSLVEEEVTVDSDSDSASDSASDTDSRPDTPFAETPQEDADVDPPTVWGRFLSPIFNG